MPDPADTTQRRSRLGRLAAASFERRRSVLAAWVLALVVAIVAGVLAAIAPARRAAKMSPMEALSHA